MSRRVALSVALGAAGALALVGLYLGIVTWAQGADHALELLWGDRVFVGLISAGFGTQVGLFTSLAVFLVELRTPLMLIGIATNLAGIAVMVRRLRRIRAGYRVVVRSGAVAA